MLQVEHPLIEGQLNDIDQHVAKAEKELNWKSPGNECRHKK